MTRSQEVATNLRRIAPRGGGSKIWRAGVPDRSGGRILDAAVFEKGVGNECPRDEAPNPATRTRSSTASIARLSARLAWLTAELPGQNNSGARMNGANRGRRSITTPLSMAYEPSRERGPDEKVMATGTLIRWLDFRGFGFIRPACGGADIFLHRSQLLASGINPYLLREGASLSFEIPAVRRAPFSSPKPGR
jgi:cold shock CspA family protein